MVAPRTRVMLEPREAKRLLDLLLTSETIQETLKAIGPERLGSLAKRLNDAADGGEPENE